MREARRSEPRKNLRYLLTRAKKPRYDFLAGRVGAARSGKDSLGIGLALLVVAPEVGLQSEVR
jgi:hypothetical protein